MKKTKRTLLCLMLAVLMVMSCAITAMASSGSGTAVSGSNRYPFSWNIYITSTYGAANVSTTDAPTTVKAWAQNRLYSEINKTYGDSAAVSATGYGTVTAKANNVLQIGSISVPSCEVTKTTAKFYVAGQHVVTATETA